MNNKNYFIKILFILITIPFIFSCSAAPGVDPAALLQANTSGSSGTLALQVQEIYPRQGDTGIAVDSYFFVVFTRPVNIATVTVNSNMSLSGGATISAGSVTWTTNNTVMYFQASASLGYGIAYTITVGMGIYDTNGNQIDTTYTSTFTTTTDPSADPAPYVIAGSRTPSAGATGVLETQSFVEVTFSEAAANVTTSTFTLLSHPAAIVSVTTADNITWRLNLSVPLVYGDVYSVDLSPDITDLTGNSLVQDGINSWSFTVRNDPSLPTSGTQSVTSVWVSGTGNLIASINFTTNYPVDTSTCSINYGTGTNYGGTTSGIAGVRSTHSINLAGLTQGTMYYFRINVPLIPAQTTFPATGYPLTFATTGDGTSNFQIETTGGNSNLITLQNTDIQGASDGSSFVIWKRGVNMFGNHFANDNVPTKNWTAGGASIDSNNRSNGRLFSDGHGYAIVTMEGGGAIYAKRVYNNAGSLAFDANWGANAGAAGIFVGTGANPSAVVVWGDQGNNNVDGGFITKRTSGTAVVFADNANYIYDYSNDLTGYGIAAGDIVADTTNHDSSTVSNVGGAGSYRHVIEQNAVDSVNTGNAYSIASNTNKEVSANATNHSINFTSPSSTVNYNNPTGGLPSLNLYTGHNYNPVKGGWTVNAGDILYDDIANYRVINTVTQIDFAAGNVINYNGNTTDAATTVNRLIDVSTNFTGTAVGDLAENTASGLYAEVTDITNVASGIVVVAGSIFNTNGQGYDVSQRTFITSGFSGINSSANPNEVIDAGSDYSGVAIGDVVKNTTTGAYTDITNVNDGTDTLTLGANIMNLNDTYAVYQKTSIFSGTSSNVLVDTGITFQTDGLASAGDIAENTSSGSFAKILSIATETIIAVDANIFAAGSQNYRIHDGNYCNTHYPANLFDPFYRIAVDLNIAANVVTFTIYDSLYSGTADKRPLNPLFDNTLARNFIVDSVANNDMVINTTTYSGAGNPNIARMDTAVTDTFSVKRRALNLSVNMMNNGDTYEILTFNPDVPNGDLIETGDVDNVASPNILVDNSASTNFTTASVKKGDLVYNITGQKYAVVVSRDTANQLTLNKNTFSAIGDEYIVFRSDERLTEAGTVTTSGNPFTDTNADYTNVEIGDIVRDNSMGTEAYVTAKAGNQLTLSSNIMTAAGQRYVVIQPRILFSFENGGSVFGEIFRLRDASNYASITIYNGGQSIKNIHTSSAGSGDAFVVYENFSANNRIYGKRYLGTGTNAIGGGNGSLGIDISGASATEIHLLDVKYDNNSGAYILYENNGIIYITRRDNNLASAWSFNFAGADPAMALDSAYNPIIAYSDASGNIFARKYSSAGALTYGPVPVQSLASYAFPDAISEKYKSNISIVSDGASGVIISWVDVRYYPALGYAVFALGIDGAGAPYAAWDADTSGVAVDYNGYFIAITSVYTTTDLSLKSIFYNDGGTPYGALFIWIDDRGAFGKIYYDKKNQP